MLPILRILFGALVGEGVTDGGVVEAAAVQHPRVDGSDSDVAAPATDDASGGGGPDPESTPSNVSSSSAWQWRVEAMSWKRPFPRGQPGPSTQYGKRCENNSWVLSLPRKACASRMPKYAWTSAAVTGSLMMRLAHAASPCNLAYLLDSFTILSSISNDM
jgi:hypothetical protein